MNSFFKKVKDFLYALPFGLKGADTEIMGSNISGDGNDTSINQQVNDNRVAKHLLKGEITKEVSELRYRTYKVARETDNYEYIGNGIATKKEEKEKNDVIKFSQENKLICNDILTELNHVGSYGVEKYTVNINYISPVRFKLQEFLTFVDVVIEKGKDAITTLRFNDIRNPQAFKSKPFITELEKLEQLFINNDSYGLSRNDFAESILCMNFTTFKATDRQPDVVSYSFTSPKLIDVKHEDGEYKLVYKWDSYNRIDLTDKFYDEELEKKYVNKERKSFSPDATIEETKHKCSKCGKEIIAYKDGFIIDKDSGEPVCMDCYSKYLLSLSK